MQIGSKRFGTPVQAFGPKPRHENCYSYETRTVGLSSPSPLVYVWCVLAKHHLKVTSQEIFIAKFIRCFTGLEIFHIIFPQWILIEFCHASSGSDIFLIILWKWHNTLCASLSTKLSRKLSTNLIYVGSKRGSREASPKMGAFSIHFSDGITGIYQNLMPHWHLQVKL